MVIAMISETGSWWYLSMRIVIHLGQYPFVFTCLELVYYCFEVTHGGFVK